MIKVEDSPVHANKDSSDHEERQRIESMIDREIRQTTSYPVHVVFIGYRVSRSNVEQVSQQYRENGWLVWITSNRNLNDLIHVYLKPAGV